MRGIRIGVRLGAVALVLIGTLMTAQAQAKPDLLVSRFHIQEDSNGFVKQVTVKVTNVCTKASSASYVLVSFKQSAEPGAKTIFTVGNTVKALKGGESDIHIFPITDIKIGAGRHILVEADPYKKVGEANEDNNWLTENPHQRPSKSSGTYQCTPKV
jgi:CARDB protein